MRPSKSQVYGDGGKQRGVMGVAKLPSRRPHRARARNGRKLTPLIPQAVQLAATEKVQDTRFFGSEANLFGQEARVKGAAGARN